MINVDFKTLPKTKVGNCIYIEFNCIALCKSLQHATH